MTFTSQRFESTIIQLSSQGMHFIHVPEKIVKKMGAVNNQRLICTVNNTLSFNCALIKLKDGNGGIIINKKRLKEAGLNEGSEAEIFLKPDNSKYGMDMPVELATLLEQDPEGDERFHHLSSGKQRNIIFYVSSVKNQQLRIERAIRLIENLKSLPPGKERAVDIFG